MAETAIPYHPLTGKKYIPRYRPPIRSSKNHKAPENNFAHCIFDQTLQSASYTVSIQAIWQITELQPLVVFFYSIIF